VTTTTTTDDIKGGFWEVTDTPETLSSQPGEGSTLLWRFDLAFKRAKVKLLLELV